MDVPDVDKLSEAQRGRLARFGTAECVDVHCHCLSNLDDGPSNREDALALCRALVRDGFTTVMATPHQLGRYEGRNTPQEVRAAVGRLNEDLSAAEVPLRVLPGADVRIDPRLPSLLDNDAVLTLGDGKSYLLLELPHEVYVDPRPLITALVGRGIRPIMSHPERHPYLHPKLPMLEQWLELGAVLQITAGSLVGDFGRAAQTTAWYIVERGWASILATDAHNITSRPPRMSAAIDAISNRLCHAVARRLCVENPIRVLRGEEIVVPLAGGRGAEVRR